jgi:hypothetical protein
MWKQRLHHGATVGAINANRIGHPERRQIVATEASFRIRIPNVITDFPKTIVNCGHKTSTFYFVDDT